MLLISSDSFICNLHSGISRSFIAFSLLPRALFILTDVEYGDVRAAWRPAAYLETGIQEP